MSPLYSGRGGSTVLDRFSHAALFPLQPNVMHNGKRSYGVCSLVCNFTKSTPTKPSLLTHNEVESTPTTGISIFPVLQGGHFLSRVRSLHAPHLC